MFVGINSWYRNMRSLSLARRIMEAAYVTDENAFHLVMFAHCKRMAHLASIRNIVDEIFSGKKYTVS